MMQVAAIGERVRVLGLVSAGVTVYPADDPEAVRAAWHGMSPEVGLVIVTPAAAAALGAGLLDEECPLTAVMPS